MAEAKAGAYKPRMRGIYDDKIVKAMTDKFGYKNALEVPRIDKIVLNMGVGEATQDKKKVETSALKAGEQIGVAGTKDGSADDARLIAIK